MAETEGRGKAIGVGLTLLATLMLGSQYVALKVGLGSIQPFLYGTMVIGIGGLIMLVYTIIKGHFQLNMFRDWVALAAPIVTFGLIACQYIGLSMTTASSGALIIGANCIMVAPLSALIFKERLGKMRIAGLAIGLLGLIALTTRFNLASMASGALVGDLFMIGASFCVALTYILSRMALPRMSYDRLVLHLHLFVPVPLFACYLLSGAAPFPSGAAPFVLYVGIVCTAIPTMLWVKALKWVSIVTSSTIILAESAFAVFLSFLILGEQIDAFVLAGAALIFIAIILAVRGQPAEAVPIVKSNGEE
jgi:drug/metabolite transporter (DMT)-like permease